MYYLNNFLFFSILGFIFETITFKILGYHNESGFMYLWWTPFYGCGVLISMITYKILSRLIPNKKIMNVVLFITLFIILTLLEFIGGHLLEMTHGYSLWNYNNYPLHLGKYVSIPTSLAWVLFSFAYIYIIKKYSDKLEKKIPKWITILTTLIFIVDFILTSYKLIYNHL